MSRHFRAIAGNLELFTGAYFVAFGVLASLYFRRIHSDYGMLAAAGGVVVGLLLILRARSVLGWHGWIFWLVALALIAVPIAWLAPALISLKDLGLMSLFR